LISKCQRTLAFSDDRWVRGRRLPERGTTIAKVLNAMRFRLARQLLSETDLAFVEIAAMLNYTDASTFTRAFRAWSGTTPTGVLGERELHSLVFTDAAKAAFQPRMCKAGG
jgi:AraC-like DNA-binding protein